MNNTDQDTQEDRGRCDSQSKEETPITESGNLGFTRGIVKAINDTLHSTGDEAQEKHIDPRHINELHAVRKFAVIQRAKKKLERKIETHCSSEQIAASIQD